MQGQFAAGVPAPVVQPSAQQGGMEVPSGNLPAGFDVSDCKNVYVGNINLNVTEQLLAEVFTTCGPLSNCKLIRKEKSSFGFVDFFDHRSAAQALLTLNGRILMGDPIKVNWAFQSNKREDTTSHHSLFVGDLSPEITDQILHKAFGVYPSISDARVMWDQASGRSRGFGFVSFRDQADAERAMTEMSGQMLGSRQIRCNWATRQNAPQGGGGGGGFGGGFGGNDMMQATRGPREGTGFAQAVGGGFGMGGNLNPGFNQQQGFGGPQAFPQGAANGGGQFSQFGASQMGFPVADTTQYTTAYIGNLAPDVTLTELHRQFHALNVGVIVDVKINREKGFGFVRYQTHEEAALAITASNGLMINGRQIRVSWGTKPTPPNAPNTPLPAPPPRVPGAVDAMGPAVGFMPQQPGMFPNQGLLPIPQQGLQMGMDGGQMGGVNQMGLMTDMTGYGVMNPQGFAPQQMQSNMGQFGQQPQMGQQMGQQPQMGQQQFYYQQ